jgi:ribonuclease Z
MPHTLKGFIVAITIAIATALFIQPGSPLIMQAEAAGGVIFSRNQIAPNRYVYYPGTEVLGEEEMRVIACGTGLPNGRRSQAASCFLIELGNGDKFLFDVGTGSVANLASLMIPYAWLDKIFLTHLHTDHIGDLDVIWAGGWTAGRFHSLEIWGPSGATPEMGTRYAMEHFLETFRWDKVTRQAKISPPGGELIVNEFDYSIPNQVVYDKNGVVVRSWPAIHIADGPVSYSLEWKGMKVVFGGDTGPNKWFVENATNADLVIHEAFLLPEQMVKFYNLPPVAALMVCCQLHTSPQAFGKVMSAVKPRHAVAYHFYNDEATRYALHEGVRETYQGPLSMATDMMVWNITREAITERMAVSVDDAWGVSTPGKPAPGDGKNWMSETIANGRWKPAYDAQGKVLDDFVQQYGIKPEQDWRNQE